MGGRQREHSVDHTRAARAGTAHRGSAERPTGAGRARRPPPRYTTGVPAPTLSSVILRVSDLERALAFWRDAVGLPVRGAGGPFAILEAGAVAIVLNRLDPPPGGAEGGLAAATEVVLEVPDVRAAHAAMKARGVPFRTEPRPVTRQGDRALWACDFRDPDGHLASITGWESG